LIIAAVIFDSMREHGIKAGVRTTLVMILVPLFSAGDDSGSI
jgi:hypothetical protein